MVPGQVLPYGDDHSGCWGQALPHRGDHSGYRGQMLPLRGDHSGFQGPVLPHRGDHSGYQGQASPQRDDRFDYHEQVLLHDHFGQESQSERSDCHIPTTCHVKVNRSTLNPEAPVWQNNADHRSQFQAHDNDSSTNLGDILRAQQQVCQQMVSTLHVPNPKIMTCSGDPMQYWKFITNFETAIESQVSDNRKRLGYLIQHCTGESKAYIKDCVIMPESEGYRRAQELLHKHYGQPHIIARAYISNLMNGPQIRGGVMQLYQD